jgi:predicted small lipoprotein YifL
MKIDCYKENATKSVVILRALFARRIPLIKYFVVGDPSSKKRSQDDNALRCTFLAVTCLLFSLLLTSCGQSGKLYLPYGQQKIVPADSPQNNEHYS